MNLVIDASNIIIGGGLTHLKELLRYANPRQYGFKKVQLWAPDVTLNKIEKREWLIKNSHSLLNKGYSSRFFWKYSIFKKSLNDTDVVFMPGTSYISCNCKVVTMCRNLLPLEKTERQRFFPGTIWLRLRILQSLHLRAFRKANGVIFLNQYCYLKARQLTNGISNYQIIPHGVSEKFKFRRNGYEINDAFNLLYVSTLDLYKHQWLIAKAVLNLRTKGYPVSLTLIGEALAGAEEKFYNILNKYENERNHVNWIGNVSYEHLYKHYKNTDAFIYGSTCETFGMPLLEAMAASLPIACSNKSSMENLLGNSGIYFNPENVSSIENVILKLFNDKELREQLGKNSHKIAMDYSWKSTADKTFQYLSKISSS